MKAEAAANDPAFGRRLSLVEEWTVPLEFVIACASGLPLSRLVRKQLNKTDAAKPTAKVFVRSNRFFALVDFHGGRPSLLLPLEVWASENR